VASDAFVLVDDHNAVGLSLLYGAGRAGGFTGRHGTVQAGMGNTSVQYLGELTFPNIENPAPFHSRFNAVQALAGNFTGMALDAAKGFKIYSILF
jgi:hypothetical protein